jgi:F420-non-reducing hydrogenase large subunit
MTRQIKIAPVTRIEGDAELKLVFDDGNVLRDTQFKITGPVRGFELFLCGNLGEEVPHLATRICGFCYSPHMLASVKAIEDAWGVTPPEDAVKLRRLMLQASDVQDHALHYVMLACSDFLCTPYSKGGITAMIKSDKELVEAAFELREFGQTVNRIIGGRQIHPMTAVPGGMTKALGKEDTETIGKMLKNSWKAMEVVKSRTHKVLEESKKVADSFRDVETYHLFLEQKGEPEFYDAPLILMDKKGKKTKIDNHDYSKRLKKPSVDYSFVTHPYLEGMDPEELVRVGPLSRINGSKWDSELVRSFDKVFPRPQQNVFANHVARVIEMEENLKVVEDILNDGIGTHIRDTVEPKSGTGVGIVEAPRGILYHCYTTNNEGVVTHASILTPTAQNQHPIEKSSEAMAKQIIGKSPNSSEEDLNRVEMVVRAYDPCVSCALRMVHIKRGEK